MSSLQKIDSWAPVDWSSIVTSLDTLVAVQLYVKWMSELPELAQENRKAAAALAAQNLQSAVDALTAIIRGLGLTASASTLAPVPRAKLEFS
jgi:hypothetical protein